MFSRGVLGAIERGGEGHAKDFLSFGHVVLIRGHTLVLNRSL